MAKHRSTTPALFAIVAACALAPAASAAKPPPSTLLSGYGGPGQGNQAILGSTLIGGGKGGHSGGGSVGGSGAPQPVSIEATQAGQGSIARARVGAAAATGGKRAHRRSSRGGAAPAPETIGRVLDVRAASAPALGLTGRDVAYIVLAVLALALTAALTVILSRGGGRA